MQSAKVELCFKNIKVLKIYFIKINKVGNKLKNIFYHIIVYSWFINVFQIYRVKEF